MDSLWEFEYNEKYLGLVFFVASFGASLVD